MYGNKTCQGENKHKYAPFSAPIIIYFNFYSVFYWNCVMEKDNMMEYGDKTVDCLSESQLLIRLKCNENSVDFLLYDINILYWNSAK